MPVSYTHLTLPTKKFGGETGGAMLSISDIYRFYYQRNFHDFRCKNSWVLFI